MKSAYVGRGESHICQITKQKLKQQLRVFLLYFLFPIVIRGCAEASGIERTLCTEQSGVSVYVYVFLLAGVIEHLLLVDNMGK